MMRLYIVVRSSLEAGLVAAQAVHAGFLFGAEYPHLHNYWYKESNNVVILQDDDIGSLATRLEEGGFRLSRFHEPDLDDELTAICVEPNAWKQLSSLRLAGKKTERQDQAA